MDEYFGEVDEYDLERYELKADGILRRWWKAYDGVAVCGYIHGDRKGRFHHGESMTTSEVLEWIPNEEEPFAIRTRNSVYILEDRAF